MHDQSVLAICKLFVEFDAQLVRGHLTERDVAVEHFRVVTLQLDENAREQFVRHRRVRLDDARREQVAGKRYINRLLSLDNFFYFVVVFFLRKKISTLRNMAW